MARTAGAGDENTPTSPMAANRSRAAKGKQVVRDESDEDERDQQEQSGSDGEQGDDGNEDEHDAAVAAAKAQATQMPPQTIEQQRELRAGYRALQAEIDDARKDLRTVDLKTLSKGVEDAEELFVRVQSTSEAVLDSRVLLAASDAGALKARQMKIEGNAFDTDDFVRRLARFMGGRIHKGNSIRNAQDDRSLNWDRLGRVLGAQSRRINGINFMYGPLSVEVKQKKKTQRQATQKADPKKIVRPDQVDTAGDPEKDRLELTRLVQRMAAHLQKAVGENQSIPYLAFIVNPHSFTETVENMFHFAFLIKEGKACLEVESEGEHAGDLVAFRTDGPDLNGEEKNQVEQNHVFEMTEALWRSAIEAYDIHEPVIPTRYID